MMQFQAGRYLRFSIIGSSFLCIGRSRDENCHQQTRIRRTCNRLLKSIPGNKLLLDHYLDGAIEAEADAICDADGNVYINRNYGAH